MAYLFKPKFENERNAVTFLTADITNSPMALSPPSRPAGKGSTTILNPSALPTRKEKDRRLPASFTNPLQLQHHQIQLPNQSTNLFKSSLEKSIDHQQEKLDTLKQKELQLSVRIKEYTELKRTGSGQRRGNCHLRENHNRLNCPHPECVTSFHCGERAKHAEEMATLKDLEKQHKDFVKEREALESELRLLKKRMVDLTCFQKHAEKYKIRSTGCTY